MTTAQMVARMRLSQAMMWERGIATDLSLSV